MPRRAKRDVVFSLCLVASLALLAVPVVGDAWMQREADEAIATSTSVSNAETGAWLLEQAQRYNARLAGESTNEAILGYDEQLAQDETGIMGWIEIPRINVKLPIYHGTAEDTLATGVGHLEQTSLPVGGTSSNCVLAAHTGMSLARMFDNIGKLENGDLIYLHVLDQELVYEVCGQQVVWPSETTMLGIEDGRDLVTLVTCTPYGINDHRLLVQAQRTEREAVQDSPVEDALQSMDERSLPLAFGLAATGAMLIARTRTSKIRRRRKQR